MKQPARKCDKRKTTKSFESKLDKHWEALTLVYNFDVDLTTGSELNSLVDEDLELNIVVDSQRSAADLIVPVSI